MGRPIFFHFIFYFFFLLPCCFPLHFLFNHFLFCATFSCYFLLSFSVEWAGVKNTWTLFWKYMKVYVYSCIYFISKYMNFSNTWSFFHKHKPVFNICIYFCKDGTSIFFSNICIFYAICIFLNEFYLWIPFAYCHRDPYTLYVTLLPFRFLWVLVLVWSQSMLRRT